MQRRTTNAQVFNTHKHMPVESRYVPVASIRITTPVSNLFNELIRLSTTHLDSRVQRQCVYCTLMPIAPV